MLSRWNLQKISEIIRQRQEQQKVQKCSANCAIVEGMRATQRGSLGLEMEKCQRRNNMTSIWTDLPLKSPPAGTPEADIMAGSEWRWSMLCVVCSGLLDDCVCCNCCWVVPTVWGPWQTTFVTGTSGLMEDRNYSGPNPLQLRSYFAKIWKEQ